MEIADVIIRVGIGAAVLAALWFAARPRYAFTLSIDQGTVRKMGGTVTRAFLQEVEEVCRREGVARGRIYGIQRGRSIVLRFAGPIPETCRQQLRNLWHSHGTLR